MLDQGLDPGAGPGGTGHDLTVHQAPFPCLGLDCSGCPSTLRLLGRVSHPCIFAANPLCSPRS